MLLRTSLSEIFLPIPDVVELSHYSIWGILFWKATPIFIHWFNLVFIFVVTSYWSYHWNCFYLICKQKSPKKCRLLILIHSRRGKEAVPDQTKDGSLEKKSIPWKSLNMGSFSMSKFIPWRCELWRFRTGTKEGVLPNFWLNFYSGGAEPKLTRAFTVGVEAADSLQP